MQFSENSQTISKINNILKNYNNLLYFLLVFHTVAYIIFRILDKSYQTWDSAGHMALTMRFSELYKSFFFGNGTTLYDIATESNYYPPLIHQITAVVNLIFGNNYAIQLSLIFIAFLLTIWLLFKLVKELGFSDKTAFFTAFFYSTFPLVADQARLFHLEIPMVLSLLLCYLFLLRSKLLTSQKYTLLFFVFFGVLQLIKWYGFLFLVVPVLYVLYQNYFDVYQRKRILKNILLGSLLFLLIALPWYILNLEELLLLSSLFSTGESDDPTIMLSFENLTFYLRSLITYQVFWIPFFSSIAGIVLLSKRNKEWAILMGIHILLIYIGFTFIENKNPRYIFGMLPQIAFLTAYFVSFLNKRLLSVVIVLFSLLGFVFMSYNNIGNDSTEAKAWSVVFTGTFNLQPDLYTFDSYKPPVETVFGFILNDIRNSKIGDTSVGVMSQVDDKRVSAATLEMERLKEGLSNIFMPVPYYQFEPFTSDYEIIKYLRDKNVTYVIAPEDPGPKGLRNYAALLQASEFMHFRSANWFEKLEVFETIDNDLTIYKRKEFDVPVSVNSCDVIQPDGDGNFNFTIEPLASLLLFTGHYSYETVSKTYEPTTLQVVELNNYEVYPKEINLTNLPSSGFSYCHRLGTKLKIKEEISKAFLENKYSCGDKMCSTVVHTKINASNSLDITETKYISTDFTGVGLEGTLKKLKVIPYYEDEYSIKEDIFVEYSNK